MPISAKNFNGLLYDATPQDIANFNAVLMYLQQSQLGVSILTELLSRHVHVDFYSSVFHGAKYNPNAQKPPLPQLNTFESEDHPNTIYWNSSDADGVYGNLPGNLGGGSPIGINTAALTFLHEAAHATDPDYVAHDADGFKKKYPPYGANALETYAIGKELLADVELGEVQRLNHSGAT